MHGAWALSCIPPPMDAKVRARSHFAAAAAVFVGQVVEVGAKVEEDWSTSTVARLKPERWLKGAEAPEVRVLLPQWFRRGARLLVFARTNTAADRLRLTESRRRHQWLDGRAVDTAVKVPDADIPDLTAAGACEESAFPLNSASLSQAPGGADAAGSDRFVALANDMLKALEAVPAGSGGRLQLTLNAFDMSDAMPQMTWLSTELRAAKGSVSVGLKLRGPSTIQHLAVRWFGPHASGANAWMGEALPAGEYRVEVPRLPGYEVQCWRDPRADCSRVKVEDRGLVRHDVFYVPNARLKVKLVDGQGAPAQGMGLLRVRRLSGDLPGLPFPVSREASFVVRPLSPDFNYLGLSDGRYAVEWLVPEVVPGKSGDWPWARKVSRSTALPLRGGQVVDIVPGDNFVTVTLPAEIRSAELRVRVPGCKPSGQLQGELLTEWRSGRAAAMKDIVDDSLDGACELRYQGFSGQHLHLHYFDSRSDLSAQAWVVLQAGENWVELVPSKTPRD